MTLRNQLHALIFTAAMFGLAAPGVLGQCDPGNIESVDKINTLVIDARPSEINKVEGRTAFKKRAVVTITNMNPFLFKYDVKVDQTEIADTAALDFIKLLGAPITDLAQVRSFAAFRASVDADEQIKAPGNLERLIKLTEGVPSIPGSCSRANSVLATEALRYLAETRQDMLDAKKKIDNKIENLQKGYSKARAVYVIQQDTIYSPTADARAVCGASNTLYSALFDKEPTYPQHKQLNDLKSDIEELDSLINELKNSASAFKADPQFAECQARQNGFSYADSLDKLGTAMSEYRAGLEKKAQSMSDETKAYDLLVKVIKTFDVLKTLDDGTKKHLAGPGLKLLQNTFNVYGQFDISALDIKLVSEELKPAKPAVDSEDIDAFRATIRTEAGATGNVGSGTRRFVSLTSGEAVAAGTADRETTADAQSVGNMSDRERFVRAGLRESGDRQSVRSLGAASSSDGGSDQPNGAASDKIETKARATIGARRFELSGGMVFSSLGRIEFKPVLGYARNALGVIVDADDKPTDKRDLTKIVGLTQSSKRRFAPLVMLHTRLTNNSKYNLFFSTGITGKNDNNGFDLEYFIGPSINFLNRNVFFTFGGYAGRQQKLAGDLFVGAKLTDTDVPVRKEFQWKPGFSFTYRIPVKDSPAPSKAGQ